MIKRFLFFCFIFLLSEISFAQIINVTKVCTLPTVIPESSGLEFITKNKIWSHNDSGGNPDLYEFDSSGTLLRTLNIANATNIDWEEIRRDTSGNMYIDDMGNNANARTDLKIYKLNNFDAITGNSTSASTINFSYPDQFNFPPAQSQMNFDCEAFVAYNDSLYLFSKDRSNPYKGYTKLYRLPNQAGSYVAELLDSFYTGNVSENENSITSAALSPSQTKLILISHYACWEFTNFKNRIFFNGNVQHYYFTGGKSQYKEGVVFLTENELYLTDEKHTTAEGNLYRFSLPQNTNEVGNIDAANGLSVYPNPSSSKLTVYSNQFTVNSIQVINLFGAKMKVDVIRLSTTDLQLNTSYLTSGIYFLKTIDNIGVQRVVKFIKE
jgi:hypothetical protein